MARLLEEIGADVTLDELPGKQHWWWDSDQTNDGGVMFDKTVRTFLSKHAVPLPLPSTAFTVTSLNPAAFFGKGGCKIEQVRCLRVSLFISPVMSVFHPIFAPHLHSCFLWCLFVPFALTVSINHSKIRGKHVVIQLCVCVAEYTISSSQTPY